MGWTIFEDIHNEECWESLKDMVIVASVLELPTVNLQIEQFLDYYLDTQGADGWLGPEVDRMMHVADAQPTRTGRIVTALHKFVALVNKMMRKGEGLEEDAYAYAGDFLVVLQWLYDIHPDGKEDVLAETMTMVAWTRDHQSQWADVFKEVNLGGDQWKPDAGAAFLGTNLAKSLTTLGARSRMTGERSDQDALRVAWQDAIQNVGQPFGLLARNPHNRVMGVEPECSQYLYTLTGDPIYADNVDRIFYGVVQFTHWGLYYRLDQSTDEAFCELFNLKHRGDSQCGELVYPEGTFDFASGAFQTSADKTSLIHVHPGPFSVNTTLAGNNRVAVIVDTTYPYSSEVPLTTTVVSQQAFVYYMRIPSGSSGATVSVNGSDFVPCHPTEDGLHAIQIEPGTTTFVIKLPLNIVTETSPSGNVVVTQGPILFVFDEFQQMGNDGSGQGIQYAIDPSTLGYSPFKGLWNLQSKGAQLQHTIVVAARSLLQVPSAQASLIQLDSATSPSNDTIVNITLTPYAHSMFPRLVMSNFPTFSLAGADPSST
ncbi:hypothetical protein C2E23DRAFT_888798 [Lenzites betulinus]|nr:hypothetical protein C2E23DRAFT_888798 [Lenzites betulinus]